MPKRSRTSHIPSQIRRRKPRRQKDFASALAGSRTLQDIAEAEAAIVPPTPDAAAATATAAPAPRMGRRLAAASRTRESVAVRANTGQLPTFERAYLIRELTQIAVISGALLLLLVVLFFVMR